MSSDNHDLSPDFSAPNHPALRLPSLPRRLPLIERLTSEAIDLPQVAPYRPRAQFTFIAGDDPAELGGYEGQLEVVGRCLEWFVFDYIIPELDGTPAQHWLELNAGSLSVEQIADVRDCLDFVLSLFEVADIDPGHGFTALDLLHPGDSYNVVEHLISNEISIGQLLLGRLFPHRGTFALSGMAALMDAHATDQIKEFIDQGKLKPAAIIKDMDGLELENLFGRSVHDAARCHNLDEIYRRLRRYLATLEPPFVSFDDLRLHIESCRDPLQFAADLCQKIPVFCRHEMDLLYALTSAAWHKYHNS